MSQSGNHAIVSRLLDENVRGLVLYARQWDPANAEDLVQEAFLRLLTESPLPDSPKAWLYRVVRNLAIDHVRRENTRLQYESQSRERKRAEKGRGMKWYSAQFQNHHS